MMCCQFDRHRVKVENGARRNQSQQQGSSATSSSLTLALPLARRDFAGIRDAIGIHWDSSRST